MEVALGGVNAVAPHKIIGSKEAYPAALCGLVGACRPCGDHHDKKKQHVTSHMCVWGSLSMGDLMHVSYRSLHYYQNYLRYCVKNFCQNCCRGHSDITVCNQKCPNSVISLFPFHLDHCI